MYGQILIESLQMVFLGGDKRGNRIRIAINSIKIVKTLSYLHRSMKGNRFADDGDAEGVGELAPGRVPATVSDVKLVNAFFKGRKTPDQASG